jgi:hypothetical protein
MCFQSTAAGIGWICPWRRLSEMTTAIKTGQEQAFNSVVPERVVVALTKIQRHLPSWFLSPHELVCLKPEMPNNIFPSISSTLIFRGIWGVEPAT